MLEYWYIEHCLLAQRFYFTSKFVKNTSLRVVFSTLFFWKWSFVFHISLPKFKIRGFNFWILFWFDWNLNGPFGLGVFFWNKTSDRVTRGTLFCSHSLRISSSISKDRNYLRLSDPDGPWQGKSRTIFAWRRTSWTCMNPQFFEPLNIFNLKDLKLFTSSKLSNVILLRIF